jgi:FHS family Na+ dependent glucose MFS transporter 1
MDLILANLVIPYVRGYWLSTFLFFIQGIGIGIYDIGGNQIILRLWSGISNSPVNAMHSGYGIGAIFAVQILKFYIKFDPLMKIDESVQNSTLNHRNLKLITTDDIDLAVPYTFGGLFGIAIVIAFLIAQYFENNALKKYAEKDHSSMPLNEPSCVLHDNRVESMQKIIFGKKFKDSTSFLIVSLIAILIFFLFMFANGTITIVNTFMLTYLTNGPAKFNVAIFIQLQTLYWIFFIFGRLGAAFLGFKMNSLIFFLILVLIELFFIILYCVPFFNSNQTFYWFLIPILGAILGPLVPSCFMVPKYLFKNINAFLLSIFFIGIGFGNMISQYITGVILDKFIIENNLFYYTNPTSTYLIPFIALAFILICTILYLIIIFFYKNFRTVIF